MPRFVAFLRAINVGGRTVTMDRLREVFRDLGLDEVETFIASGNVLFRTGARSSAGLERKIEAALERSLGYEVATFLRTVDDVIALAEMQPFPPSAMTSEATLYVGFLAGPLDGAAEQRILAFRTEVDDFRVIGREVFWLCRTRQVESKFSNAAFERALRVRATFRGINTVRRLATRVGPGASGVRPGRAQHPDRDSK